jgi:Na+/proline symporter
MPHLSDKGFLTVMRVCLVGFAGCVLLYALNSERSIFGMVESAYKITLAGAFVPLAFGAFWKRATNQGALAAIIGGISTWILVEVLIGEESPIPPQLIGLGVSIIAMLLGSLLPQKIGGTPPPHPRFLHEHAARPHPH